MLYRRFFSNHFLRLEHKRACELPTAVRLILLGLVMFFLSACVRQGFNVYDEKKAQDSSPFLSDQLIKGGDTTTNNSSGDGDGARQSNDASGDLSAYADLYQLPRDSKLLDRNVRDCSSCGDARDGNSDGSSTTTHVTGANNTCATAATVDLKNIALGKPVTFSLDPTGATRNYTYDSKSCTSYVDVVAKIINSPGQMSIGCDQGGDFCASAPFSNPTECPPTSSKIGTTSGCSSSSKTSSTWPKGTFFMIFWRSASAGPTNITFSVDPL